MDCVAECCTRIRIASFIGVDFAAGVDLTDGVAEARAEGVLLSADFSNGVEIAEGVAEAFAEGVEAILLEGVPREFADLAGELFSFFALLPGEGDGS